MRQWDQRRTLTEAFSDAIVQRSGSEKTCDRHLSDEDDHFRLQELQLRVEPVGTVRHGRRRRTQVAGVLAVAAWKAAHQSCGGGQATEVVSGLEPGADHPPVKLLSPR